MSILQRIFTYFFRNQSNIYIQRSNEIRFAVGDPAGRRSGIWKFAINGSDIYISSQVIGSEAKISLHASGQCRFARTSAWVTQLPQRKNADRLIENWLSPRPNGTAAQNVFRIHIPESELRAIVDPDLNANVEWITSPPTGHITSLECYISPVSQSDPALNAALPHPCLCSLQMACGRWLIVLNFTAPRSNLNIAALRTRIEMEAKKHGKQLPVGQRAAAFAIGADKVRGCIELVARQ